MTHFQLQDVCDHAPKHKHLAYSITSLLHHQPNWLTACYFFWLVTTKHGMLCTLNTYLLLLNTYLCSHIHTYTPSTLFPHTLKLIYTLSTYTLFPCTLSVPSYPNHILSVSTHLFIFCSHKHTLKTYLMPSHTLLTTYLLFPITYLLYPSCFL